MNDAQNSAAVAVADDIQRDPRGLRKELEIAEPESAVFPQTYVAQKEVTALAHEISVFVSDFKQGSEKLERDKAAEISDADRIYNAAKSRFERDRDSKISSARADLEIARAEAKRVFQNISDECSKLLAKVTGFVESAKTHIKEQKLEIRPNLAVAGRAPRHSHSGIEQADLAAGSAKTTLATIKGITYNPQILKNFIKVVAAFGLVLGAMLGIASGSFALFLFIFGLFVAGGFAAEYFWKDGITRRLSNVFLELEEDWKITDSCTRRHISVEEKKCNQLIDKATSEFKKIETKLQVEHGETKRTLEDAFHRESSERRLRHQNMTADFRARAKANAEILKARCNQIQEDTYFAGRSWGTDWSDWSPNTSEERITPASITFGSTTLSETLLVGGTEYRFTLPALMSLDNGRGILFKVSGPQKSLAVRSVQSVMLHLLACMPPGMVRFTMFDPIGLGQNVAAFMPLAKYDEKLVTSRAWSEPRHIEKELEQLSMHLQDVIQTRLRNDHKTIEEYNLKSKVKEPYRIVVAIDFPANFSEDSVRRLISIAENGARCGVYPLVVVDMDTLSKNAPYKFDLDNLSRHLEVVENGETKSFQHRSSTANNSDDKAEGLTDETAQRDGSWITIPDQREGFQIPLSVSPNAQVFISPAIDFETCANKSVYLVFRLRGANSDFTRRAIRAVKIAAKGEIEAVISSNLPGLSFTQTVHAESIPLPADYIYCRLVTSGPYWNRIKSSGMISVFVPSELQEMTPELYVWELPISQANINN